MNMKQTIAYTILAFSFLSSSCHITQIRQAYLQNSIYKIIP